MSTLKTNNFEHLDASSPNITLGIGGGVNISGIATAETGLRVTSGLVGIGTNIPSTSLDVAGSNVPVVINSSNSNTYKIQLENAYTPVAYIGAATSEIYFADADAAEIARFNTDGLRLASGKGIDFQNTGAGSSTTAASHLLDDYEEGTWSPVYRGLTTPGSYTHGGPCTYTKIGNVVHTRATLNNITTNSVGSGNLILEGLPFMCDASNNARQVGTVQMNQFNNSVTDIFGICVRTIPGTTQMQVIGSRHDAALEIFQFTDKNNDNADISLQLTYEIEPA